MGTTQRTDADLVATIRTGDRAAWGEVWDRYGDRLYGYARRLLGSDADAADAVSDTFLAAAEHLDQLRDAAALRPWLYAICRRQVQRRWRHRSRTIPVSETTEATVDDATDQHVEAQDAAEAAQQFLWAAAEGLGPEDRELLALALAADLDSGEIARISGMAPETVYVKVSRLKATLARSAGALFVARHGRRDCGALAELLAPWDGTLTTVWRKRIARHVDGCDACGRRRPTAASMAATPALALVAPAGLGDEVVGRLISATTPLAATVRIRFGRDGWPVPEPWRRRRLAGIVGGLLAVVVAVALVLGLAVLAGDEEPDLTTVAGPATATEATVPPTLPSAPGARALVLPGGLGDGPAPVPADRDVPTPPSSAPTVLDTRGGGTSEPTTATSTPDVTTPPEASSTSTETTAPPPPPALSLAVDPAPCPGTGAPGPARRVAVQVQANGIAGDRVEVTWSARGITGERTLGPGGGGFDVDVPWGSPLTVTARLVKDDGSPGATRRASVPGCSPRG